ncbi:MAG: dTDP-4-dehydrorhamnose 3,5-epimerase [Hyphomicrobiaceae bacterium]|nr:dTDP-4-dehydrorhamnose 3,5-epimerase [Hyphomicrobiaceae bacterium]
MPKNVTVKRLEIPDVILIAPAKFGDDRGFFSETYNAATFREAGIDATFVQDNQSLSRSSGVVRGLHFQKPPHAQGKLIRVVRGRIFDVAVDIRTGSPTFGHHVRAELSAENWQQLWIPPGFAHAFCTLEPDTEVFYKVTDFYAPECDAGILWNDPDLEIDWPISSSEAILSPKDTNLPRLADLSEIFTYSG